jgi:hypothetical protein
VRRLFFPVHDRDFDIGEPGVPQQISQFNF